MNYAAILNALALAIPAILAGTKTLVKGRERYVIAIAAFFVLRKFAMDAAKEKSLSDLQESGGVTNANALATLYRQAINPTGYAWTKDFDGTDEELLFELAAKTYNYKAVYDAYKKQYGDDLTNDIRGELNNTDYQRFLTILNK